jgi:diaminopimelate epimerase
VFFVPDAAAIDLRAVGPEIEHHPLFPERANVSFAQVTGRDRIMLRVWERGAGATLACGSAACAALVAAARAGLTDRRAAVALPGGELTITWRAEDDRVLMTGPVEFEFETRLDPAAFAELAA